MAPTWVVSNRAEACTRRARPGTVREVLGKALAAVALFVLAAPVGASADTIWTAAGNGTGCLIASCPTGIPALSGAVVSQHNTQSGVGIAIDPDGSVVFSDQDYRVKRIRNDGILETVAGNGTQCPVNTGNPSAGPACGAGGPATSASFAFPMGVAVGPAGDVFVVDYAGRRVRKVNRATGTLQAMAGNGNVPYPCAGMACNVEDASTVALTEPQHIVAAKNGEVFVSEPYGGVVRRLTPVGNTYRMRPVAPGFAMAPFGLALDPTQTVLYVTETTRVLRIDLTKDPETVTVIAGSATACLDMATPCGDGGPATAATLNGTWDIAVDGNGRIYIANEVPNNTGIDPAPGRIRTFLPGGVITNYAGTGAACSPPGPCGDGGNALQAQLLSPHALAYDTTRRRLYVKEYGNPRVRYIAAAPGATTEAAQAVGLNSGTMAATLTTDGLPVTYRFEYGPTTAYGFQTTTSTAAVTTAPQTVTQALGNLAAGTTTHYRIVATDAGGTETAGADVAFTTLVPGPGVGPTTATITSSKLTVKWKKGVPSGTLEVKGATDGAANLTVTLRRLVASGTRSVKGWTVKRTAAGAFTAKLTLPKVAKSLLPGKYRIDITGNSSGGKVPVVLGKTLKLVGPKAGIVIDAFASATKNGAPVSRLRGDRRIIWVTFQFGALPTKGVIRVDWKDPLGNNIKGPTKPRRTIVNGTYRYSNGGVLRKGRYTAILKVGGVEQRRISFRLG